MFEIGKDITDALQQRIDDLSANGGGEICLSAGKYHFRPIRLRSNICLNLEAGAELIASGCREDYQAIGYEHNEFIDTFSAIYAFDETNITIKGEGLLNLNGESFYHMDRPTEVETVGPEVTQEYLDEAPREWDWRVNQPVFFHQCQNIRLDGIRIIDAPCWTLSFNLCETVSVTNLTIDNSLIIPNNDGMHFTGSRNIIINNCHVSAGDDCVALTSITDWDAPCENVVISNCVFRSASKAISVGYMHSIVRNVQITNVVIRESNRAFVSMCHPGTGLVENVQVSNCFFEGRCYGGNWWGNGESILLMTTPHHVERYLRPLPPKRFDVSMRNISFSHITCISERPVGLVASEPMIKNVRLKDFIIDFKKEERPSLKGHAFDLAPGPENYEIPEEGVGIIYKNADFDAQNVVNQDGDAVKVLNIG